MASLSGLCARLVIPLRDRLGPGPALEPPPGPLVLGINLGGGPVTIQGQAWLGQAQAEQAGRLDLPGVHAATSGMAPTPYAEPDVRAMLNAVVFRPTTLELTLHLDDGDYALALWLMENHQSHWHRLTLRIDGVVRDTGVGDLERRAWRRYGPYPVRVAQGRLALSLDTGQPGVDAHLMGLSVYRVAPAAR